MEMAPLVGVQSSLVFIMNSEDRKTVVSAIFLSTLIILLGTAFYGAANEDAPAIRKFRPVKMAKVEKANPAARVRVIDAPSQVMRSAQLEPPTSIQPVIRTGKTAIPDPVGDAAKASDLGWMYFDRQKWESAQDWFITALEWDPANVDSAKGLVMSIYYGGATGDAYQLGRELGMAMPEIRSVVPDAVAGEVAQMLKSSKFEAAEKLLKRFPSTDPSFIAIAKDVKKAAQADPGTVASVHSAGISDVSSVVDFTRKSKAGDSQ